MDSKADYWGAIPAVVVVSIACLIANEVVKWITG